MSPLLLGAAWILFVISCVASMTPKAKTAQPKGGKDDQAT